jgi:ferredoxin
MQIEVDYDLCESHARCVEAAPDIFEIRDDDLMYVLDDSPGAERRAAVERAVTNCPRQALRLVEG